MNINSIKNIAAQNCCYDQNKNPIQIGDMVCFANGTAYGGTPVYTAIVDKIKPDVNKIHVNSQHTGTNVYLRAQYCLNVSKLFNIDINLTASEILKEKQKIQSQKIIEKQIIGIFINKNERGFFYIKISSKPGQDISKSDIKNAIDNFIKDSMCQNIFILDKHFVFKPVSISNINPYLFNSSYGYFHYYDFHNNKKPYYLFYQASYLSIRDFYNISHIEKYAHKHDLTNFMFINENGKYLFGENTYNNNLLYVKNIESVLDQYVNIFKNFS